jgi:hypothetical protein
MYLHLEEFAHFRRPFEKFKSDERKRRDLLDRLRAVIVRRTQNGFCRNIVCATLNVGYPICECIGPPLALAGLTCVAAANLWHRKYADGEPLQYIFEDSDHDKKFLSQAFRD